MISLLATLLPWSYTTLMPESVRFAPDTPLKLLQARQVMHVQHGSTLFYMGYQQVATSQQDPLLIRFDAGRRTWIRNDYDHTSQDVRGYGLLWDGKRRLYAAFRTDGPLHNGPLFAGLGFGWLSTAAQARPLTVLAQLNPDNGSVVTATYLTGAGAAQPWLLTSGHFSRDGHVVLKGVTSAPRQTNHRPLSCVGNGPFMQQLVLKADLSQALDSVCLPHAISGKDWVW